MIFICIVAIFASLAVDLGKGTTYHHPGHEHEEFCEIPSILRRRIIGIWSPKAYRISVSTQEFDLDKVCPEDYPYAMYGGRYCCRKDSRVGLEYSRYSYYYNCDGVHCCKNTDESVIRCPITYSYYADSPTPCLDSRSFWIQQNEYKLNYYHGETKNVKSIEANEYHYNNIGDRNLLRKGDVIIVDCQRSRGSTSDSKSSIKAFTCEEPDVEWYKDCNYQTEEFNEKDVIVFIPHRKTLQNAQANCKRLKGNLATFGLEFNEKLAVKVMLMTSCVNHCAFIGFTDGDNEGIWRWFNGKDVTYTNWVDSHDYGWDQPNSGLGHGEEDYSVMCRYPADNPEYAFKWFDVGPPRAANPLIPYNVAYSFCTLPSLDLSPPNKNCVRPLKPCGGYYPSTGKTIPHGKWIIIECRHGFRLEGDARVYCDNGVTSTSSRCVKIRYTSTIPRTFYPLQVDTDSDRVVSSHSNNECDEEEEEEDESTTTRYGVTDQPDEPSSDDYDSIPRIHFG